MGVPEIAFQLGVPHDALEHCIPKYKPLDIGVRTFELVLEVLPPTRLASHPHLQSVHGAQSCGYKRYPYKW